MEETSAIPTRLVVQSAVSVTVLVAGLYVILSGHYTADVVAWACAVVGVVVGYWLR